MSSTRTDIGSIVAGKMLQVRKSIKGPGGSFHSHLSRVMKKYISLSTPKEES